MSRVETGVTLSQTNNWDIYRKGPRDEVLFERRVYETIRGDLTRVVADESATRVDAYGNVRVPVAIGLPHFRFNPQKALYFGQGQKDTHVGDVLGKGGESEDKDASVEFPLQRLVECICEDLGLRGSPVQEEVPKPFVDVQKVGAGRSIDVRRTVFTNMARNALSGRGARVTPIESEDLRFRTWEAQRYAEQGKRRKAVVAIRDASWSFGDEKRSIAAGVHSWLENIFKIQFGGVDTTYITHNTVAQEVDRTTFLKQPGSGETAASCAYKLAARIAAARYGEHDVSIIHFSDGNNSVLDMKEARTSMENLVRWCETAKNLSVVGYIEIKPGFLPESLSGQLSTIASPRLNIVTMCGKEDTLPVLRTLLLGSNF